MRIGVMLDQFKPIDDVVAQARSIADGGFSSAWITQVFGYDALTILSIVGREVGGIELGTGVVPTWPRHPLTLAASALTAQAASGGRLALGIGLSHQVVVEGMWGYSFDKPVRHMREYLSVLGPALRGEQVQFKGETVTAMTTGPLNLRVPQPPALLLAALGPAMLRLAGSQSDGTITWMTGPRTLAEHITPGLSSAASEAGRAAPRVVAALPICLTTDVAGAREQAAKTYAIYGTLPSYRAMLDREGADGPADVALVGDEAALGAALDSLASSGATDFVATQLGSRDDFARTVEFLKTRL
jgi:F420-dependent oxidoreductase-like protein